uniref:Uncharacterized protein n=1 Tax=Oryza brachyantha TaxID=4533 RepID=J3M0X3_ORYBR
MRSTAPFDVPPISESSSPFRCVTSALRSLIFSAFPSEVFMASSTWLSAAFLASIASASSYLAFSSCSTVECSTAMSASCWLCMLASFVRSSSSMLCGDPTLAGSDSTAPAPELSVAESSAALLRAASASWSFALASSAALLAHSSSSRTFPLSFSFSTNCSLAFTSS